MERKERYGELQDMLKEKKENRNETRKEKEKEICESRKDEENNMQRGSPYTGRANGVLSVQYTVQGTVSSEIKRYQEETDSCQ